MTSPDTQKVDIVYESDRIVAIKSSTGLEYLLSYNAQGRIERVQSSNGVEVDREVQYEYDAEGDLTAIVDPDGNTMTYQTDLEGRITEMRDETGVLIVKNNYDDNGRVTDQITGTGESSKFIYDLESRVTTVEITAITGSGEFRTDTYQYNHDDTGYTVDITDPLGEQISTIRRDDGEPVASTDRRAQSIDGGEETSTFDSFGNVLSETIPGVGTTTYEYYYSDDLATDNGIPHVRLKSVTEPYGGVTTYFYEGTNRIPSRIEAPLGNVTENTILDGLLIASKDADGVVTQYQYDDYRRLKESTDGVGNKDQFVHDIAGRQVKSVDPSGASSLLTYDNSGRLLTTTDRIGASTERVLDAAGRTMEFRDPLDFLPNSTSRIVNSYNPESGLLETNTDQRTNTISYEYNGFGQLTSQSLPGGADWTYTNAELGRVTAAADPLPESRIIQYGYDVEGEVNETMRPDGTMEMVEYDLIDRPVKQTDANGIVSTQIYNSDTGQLISKSYAVSTEDEITISYTYDQANRIETVNGPREGEIYKYTYTLAGRVHSVTDPRQNTTFYKYDSAGRVQFLVLPGDREIEYFYDANGRVQVAKSPLDLEFRNFYDKEDRLTAKTTPARVVRRFKYNNNDSIVSAQLGFNSPSLFEVDSLTLNSATDPNGGVTQHSYDDRYNLTSWQDQKNNVYQYEYDLADQLKTITDPLGRAARNEYDKLGRIDFRTDASVRTFDHEYDNGGRLTRISFNDDSSQTYTYDNLNRLTSITDLPENITTKYRYDPAGNLIEVKEADGDVISYEWDLAGNRSKIVYPDGSSVDYLYDELNRLISANHSEHGNTNYHYDDDSRLTGVEFPDKSVRQFHYIGEQLTRFSDAGKSWHLSYDAQGRINEITGEEHWSFTYDNGGQLRVAKRDNRTWHYKYDAVGNLTDVRDSENGDTTYDHDAANQLKSSVDNGVVGLFKHDHAGRLAEEVIPNGDVYRYHYDTRGRLSQVNIEKPPVVALDGKVFHVVNVDKHRNLNADSSIVGLSENRASNDQWLFKRLSNGFFTLQNKNEHKYLTVKREQFAQSEDQDIPKECRTKYNNNYCIATSSKIEITAQWRLTQHHDGIFLLINRSSGKYLSVKAHKSEVDLGRNRDNPAALWRIVEVGNESNSDHNILLEPKKESWSRTYSPDGLLSSVTNKTPEGLAKTWQLTWDRTFAIPEPLGWTGPEDITLIHGVGPALVIQNDHAQPVELGPLGDVIGSQVAVSPGYTPYGETDTGSFGLGYRGELHVGPSINLKVRDYNPRLRRLLSLDPIRARPGFAVTSRYAYAANNPINLIDSTGLVATDNDLAKAFKRPTSGSNTGFSTRGGLLGVTGLATTALAQSAIGLTQNTIGLARNIDLQCIGAGTYGVVRAVYPGSAFIPDEKIENATNKEKICAGIGQTVVGIGEIGGGAAIASGGVGTTIFGGATCVPTLGGGCALAGGVGIPLTVVGGAIAAEGLTDVVAGVSTVYSASNNSSGSSPSRSSSGPVFNTDSEAEKHANTKGFVKTNDRSSGAAVFHNPKNKVPYITRDRDGHLGGAYKGAKTVKDLGKKSTRMGTYDKELNRIAD